MDFPKWVESLAYICESGYNLARMKYEILFAPEAAEELRSLRANARAKVKDAIENYLRYEPTKVSKARIKRLRGLSRPQYCLRIEDFRVFYDVRGESVEILAILSKSEVLAWLGEEGQTEGE